MHGKPDPWASLGSCFLSRTRQTLQTRLALGTAFDYRQIFNDNLRGRKFATPKIIVAANRGGSSGVFAKGFAPRRRRLRKLAICYRKQQTNYAKLSTKSFSLFGTCHVGGGSSTFSDFRRVIGEKEMKFGNLSPTIQFESLNRLEM